MARRRTGELVRRALTVRQDCAYCGCTTSWAEYGGAYATLDHIVPTSRGGSDTLTNQTLACLACNAAKRSSTNWPAPAFTLSDLLSKAP